MQGLLRMLYETETFFFVLRKCCKYSKFGKSVLSIHSLWDSCRGSSEAFSINSFPLTKLFSILRSLHVTHLRCDIWNTPWKNNWCTSVLIDQCSDYILYKVGEHNCLTFVHSDISFQSNSLIALFLVKQSVGGINLFWLNVKYVNILKKTTLTPIPNGYLKFDRLFVMWPGKGPKISYNSKILLTWPARVMWAENVWAHWTD